MNSNIRSMAVLFGRALKHPDAEQREAAQSEIKGMRAEEEIPLTRTLELKGPLEKRPDEMSMRDGVVRVAGHSVCAVITTDANGLSMGEEAIYIPISPAQIGGARLAAFAGLYDMWRPRSIRFEWAPACPATTAGSVMGYATPATMTNPTLKSQGMAALRSALSRPGSEMVSVFAHGRFDLVYDQQNWYFTKSGLDPSLCWAGAFTLAAGVTLPANTTFGIVYCHYDIELLQAAYIPEVAAPVNQIAGEAAWSLGGGVATVFGAEVTMNMSSLNPNVPVDAGSIIRGTVVSATDGVSGSDWRKWQDADGDDIIIGPGMTLFWRYYISANTWYVYPDFASALGAYMSLKYRVACAGEAGRSMTFSYLQSIQLLENS